MVCGRRVGRQRRRLSLSAILYGPPCSFPGAKNSAFNPLPPYPIPEPSQGSAWSTRIKYNGYRLIADATAIGSGTTLPGATIGRTGKRVYIGLSERACLPLSTGSASQGEGAGETGGGGWDF